MANAARSRPAPARAPASRAGHAPSARDRAVTAGALAVVERARPAGRTAHGAGSPARQPRQDHPKQPQLRVVPAKVRRRRAGVIAVLGCAATFSVMLVLTFFQAKIAAEQMRLDSVNRDLRAAQTTHSQLVLAVAELQTPDAIVAAANHNGLVTPSTIAGYISPSPDVVNAVLTTGGPDAGGGSIVDSSTARAGAPAAAVPAPATAASGSKSKNTSNSSADTPAGTTP